MKKRYIALLALASIGVFALGGCSNEATVSGNPTTVTGTTVETTTTNMEAYEKFEYESTNKGIVITGLKDNSLTSITIPDDVYSISDNAFKDNDTLEAITFNDSLKEIGEHAFDSCSALKSIEIPASVEVIGDYAFNECSNITDVKFNKYPKLGVSIFEACKGLKKVELSSDFKIIGHNMFEYCSNLADINLPEGLTEIDMYAFQGCRSLKNVVLPESLVTIDYGAFAYTAIENIVIPKNVSNLNNQAFGGCENLEKVNIESNKISMLSGFNECINLKKINIPESVTGINSKAFNGCESLESIIIPKNVKAIYTDAFKDCYKLKEIYNLSTINIEIGATSNGSIGYYAKGVNKSLEDESVYITDGDFTYAICDEKAYIVKYNGSEKYLELPSEFTYKNEKVQVYGIADYALSNSNVYKLIIPSGIKLIEEGAFKYSINLLQVTLPDTLETIEDDAFKGCWKLIEVYNLSSLELLRTFDNDGSVARYANIIHTNEDAESILVEKDDYIFANMVDHYEGVDISLIDNPEKLFRGGYFLVGYKGAATELTLPTDSNYSIYSNAFEENENLTSIIIPENVSVIGAYAFVGCSNLANLILKNGITEIGVYAFYGCDALKKVVVRSQVKKIWNIAFGSLDNLEEVYLLTGVQEIGEYSFVECYKLKKLHLSDTITAIGSGAFRNSFSLEEVFYSGMKADFEAITIGSNVFYNEVTVHCNDGDIVLEKTSSK